MTRRDDFGRRARRSLRSVRRVVPWLLLVVLLAPLLPPVRGAVLSVVIGRLTAALPGELQRTRAAWPAPGRLELDGLLWTLDGDTLLAATTVRLDVALRPLLRRDLVVNDVSITGLRADVPALRAALPESSPAGQETGGPAAFPRSGALPPLPSTALKRVRCGVERLDFGGEQALVDGFVAASVELRRDRTVRVALDTLRFASLPPAWSVQEGRLGTGAEYGALSGHLQGRPAPDASLVLDITPRTGDAFALTLTTAGPVALDVGGEGVLRLDPPRFELLLAGTVDGRPIKRFGLKAAAPEGPEGPLQFDLRATAEELDLAFAATVTPGDTTLVALSPVHVRVDTLDVLADHPAGPQNGRIVFGPAGFTLRGVEMSGALGDWRVDGDGHDGALALDLVADLTEPPGALVRRLSLDSANWPRSAAPGLRVALRRAAAGEPLVLEGVATLPGPAQFAALLPEFRCADLGVITADLQATLAESGWRATAELGRTAWLDRGRLVAHGGPGTTRLDTLALVLPGLALRAAGSLVDGTLDGAGRIEVPDARFLSRLPGTEAFTAMSADLELQAAGPLAAPRLSAVLRVRPDADQTVALDLRTEGDDAYVLDLTAIGAVALDLQGGGTYRLDPPRFDLALAGVVAERALKHLGLTVEAPTGVGGPIQVGLRAAALDLDLAAAAVITPGDTLRIAVSPLDVAIDSLTTLLPHPAGAPTGRVTLADGTLVLEGLEVTGALGTWHLDGVQGPDGVDLTAAADWPEAPPLLRARTELAGLDWPHEAPPGLRLTLYRAPRSSETTARGSLVLPGPAAFAALLPGVRCDDLGAIHADLDAVLDDGSWQATLDLGSTDWLESGFIAANGQADAVVLERFELSLPGLSATGAGELTRDRMDVTGRVTLPDAVLLARIEGAAAFDQLEAVVDLHADGSPDAPRLQAGLTARASGPQLDFPQLDGVFFADADTLDLELSVPAGLRSGSFRLQTLDAHLVAAGPGDFARGTGLSATAVGDGLHARIDGRLASQPVFALSVDTLQVALTEGDLALRGPCTVRQDAGTGAWRIDGLDLAGSLGTAALSGLASPDSLDLLADFDLGLPMTLLRRLAPTVPWPGEASWGLALGGRLALQGTPGAPRCDGGLRATVLDETGRVDLALLSELTAAPGLVDGGFQIERAGRRIAGGRALIPGVVSLEPPGFAPSREDSFRVTCTTERLELVEYAAYLPPDITARGAVTAAFDLRGLGTEADLGGFLDAPRLRLELEDGSWMVLGGRVGLDGTVQRPVVAGKLAIVGGVIVVPDVPPPLLPASGQALLLAEPVGTPAATNGVAAAADPSRVDVSLALSCPGDLWLRGRGMTVQLSGDLLLTQKDGEPSVVGELRAVQGNYRFMGRRFELDRGVVAFYGDLDNDPQLDLELRADIEGSVYRIAMQGWALAPELRLSSEPEQTEGDIIASLLFGKPLDELDTGQENLLKARTAQILTSLGSMRLMDRMSRTLGADLISYNQSAGADAASSLLVGKYLSPKLLLKYEQFLDRSNAYTVRLDYALSRFFRVETTVGQGAESGLELKWARDY